jgi:hypothetical protein
MGAASGPSGLESDVVARSSGSSADTDPDTDAAIGPAGTYTCPTTCTNDAAAKRSACRRLRLSTVTSDAGTEHGTAAAATAGADAHYAEPDAADVLAGTDADAAHTSPNGPKRTGCFGARQSCQTAWASRSQASNACAPMAERVTPQDVHHTAAAPGGPAEEPGLRDGACRARVQAAAARAAEPEGRARAVRLRGRREVLKRV